MTEDELIEGLRADPRRRVQTIPPEDAFPPEFGAVLHPDKPIENGMVTVQLDAGEYDYTEDDGLRELSADQIEWAS
jgi:hypothetical protein